MANDFVYYDGEKFIRIPSDGRYCCRFAMVEEVDYDFFTSTDGKEVVIPVDVERPPVVVCGYGKITELKTCTGCDCKHYINEFLKKGRK